MWVAWLRDRATTRGGQEAEYPELDATAVSQAPFQLYRRSAKKYFEMVATLYSRLPFSMYLNSIVPDRGFVVSSREILGLNGAHG